jgi:putative phosphoribosyl transferase
VALFKDRKSAGQRLANALAGYCDLPDVVVLALARGGVPVAYEVANILHAPLDVIIVRKLTLPKNKDLVMGLIASGGVCLINYDVVRLINTTQFTLDAVAALEAKEIEHLEQTYRDGWPKIDIHQRKVIVVDDGIATGTTMYAAIHAISQRNPERIVIAAPTASKDSFRFLSKQVDEVVCLSIPDPYIAINRWYEDFTATPDEHVTTLLIQSVKNLCTAALNRQIH